jgi:hypothetical protein
MAPPGFNDRERLKRIELLLWAVLQQNDDILTLLVEGQGAGDPSKVDALTARVDAMRVKAKAALANVPPAGSP